MTTVAYCFIPEGIYAGQVFLRKSGMKEGRSAVVLKQGSNMIALRNDIREHGLRIERQ